ncbi:MAG: hypothetical protein JST00_44725 [Deltaproteobacteria bacterium]|nr:hypothetical protein [Deltaproteobacteria bacterium]
MGGDLHARGQRRIVRLLAVGAGLTAACGLGGTWKAWIATSTENAATHVKGNGPWLLLDGTTVAPSRQQLLGGTVVNPIERNEKNFKMAGHIHVWTGALPNGNLAGTNCNDWRATTGMGARATTPRTPSGAITSARGAQRETGSTASSSEPVLGYDA